MTQMCRVGIPSQSTFRLTIRLLSYCVVYVNSLPAQVQVLSAALKAAQLDSPTDGTKTQEDQQSESDGDSPSTESKPMEVQSESEESPSEEEQTMETLSPSESNPVQEQGDEETQTEPFDDREDSPPGSPVLV